MYSRFLSLALIISAVLMGTALAEDVYVRNRLFKGEVARSGGQLWLELAPLAKAIKWTLEGDEASGFALFEGEAPELPGAGKVAVEGAEAPLDLNNGMVGLDDLAPLIGAKVVNNEELGTIDVALVKKKGEVKAGAAQIGRYPYTLIEYYYPGEELCEYIVPTIKKAESKYDNLGVVRCNLQNGGEFAKLKKYKKTKDKSYPEVTLLNSSGEVVFQLRGNHVIERNLLPEIKKAMKK